MLEQHVGEVTCCGVVLWIFDWVESGVVHPAYCAAIVCEGKYVGLLCVVFVMVKRQFDCDYCCHEFQEVY